MAANQVTNKLKILCIHGYRQNAKIFRERTGALRKLIKKHAELVYMDAPNLVKDTTADERGWWFSRPDHDYLAQEESDVDEGFKESVDQVLKTVKEEGPFDGVLGFSQGASFVALLLALQEQKDYEFGFNFAILVAGFRGRSTGFQALYTTPVKMPTLHVFGDTDQVIAKDMSEELLQYFIEPVIMQHTGGHFVPASAPQKQVYQEFLLAMTSKVPS